jgi:putative SOS response-associated peptidase YedK
MCGRYASSRSAQDLVEEFEVERVETDERTLEPDYNVAPTKEVYAVLTRAHRDEDEARRSLRIVRWGLVPSWAKDQKIGSRMINARLETAGEKPAFRRAFARRRCLVPADGYYEWYAPEVGAAVGQPDAAPRKPRKQPFYIHRPDGASLALAGLYEFWKPADADPDDPASWLTTMTLLTTTAPDETGRIHDRAPLMIDRDHWAAWLDPSTTDPGAVMDMLRPAAPGALEAYAVSTAVNSVRNNGPSLTDPLPPDDVVALT